ncbi:MAG TPA: hypothetical protein VGU64_14430, partial [Terriglobales bacterium]|nr:hypothetical protein [Terriglobales bacterium]
RDLPAALYAAVSGQAVQPTAKLTENDTIALFPHEWLQDPASSFLQSGYHDVPWQEPELVRACVRTRVKRRGWYSRQNPIPSFSAVRFPMQERSAENSRDAGWIAKQSESPNA